MSKTLRITFSGICTRVPGHPRSGDREPEQVFVLMPAARTLKLTEDKKDQIPQHHAFIYIPAANLKEPPPPALFVDDERLGRTEVYLIDHARVRVRPRPPQQTIVHAVTDLPLAKRPGPKDVAPEFDVRWLADMRDILPPDGLSLQLNPTASDLNEEVAMIVELPAGTITANFPCKTVQPQRFRIPADPPLIAEDRVFGEERVFACEFIVAMEYPDDTESVKLVLSPLSSDVPIDGIAAKELDLVWDTASTLDIRIGNDTLDEIVALRGIARCNAREMPRARDNDFDLHYLLLGGTTGPRPRPFNGNDQTMHNGCVPASGSGGG